MSESVLKHIERSEDEALQLNDIQTAIRLNWLRNAIGSGLDYDIAVYKYLEITINGGFKEGVRYF